MRTEETTSTTAVTKNGSMENRAVGMFSGIYSLSMLSAPNTSEPVSYTHLDVYKRQPIGRSTGGASP